MGWGCVSEKSCLRCANLDVELICENRTCMKTAFVSTSFSIRADVDDPYLLENLCRQALLGQVVPVRNHRDHLLYDVTNRSLTWFNGNTRSRDSIHFTKASAWKLQRQSET